MSEPLLQVNKVSKRFERPLILIERIGALFGKKPPPHIIHALSDIDLAVMKGEALGLVGEFGCGKSTLGRIINGIYAPSDGTVTLAGKPVMANGKKETTQVQMVFQDPFASLDPRMRVGETIAEGPLAHGLVTKDNAQGFIARALQQVGLDAAYAGRFAHQFSGGQRQRIAIARALAMQPHLLVCDEPVASLDVSIQAQIINVFLHLRRELSLTLLFISHDLSVVHHLCDRVAIMYLGRIVEIGEADAVYNAPRHPYTEALLKSSPRLHMGDDEVTFSTISGELPSPLKPPSGCAFRTRCPRAAALCATERPLLVETGSRAVACHFPVGS